MKLLVKVTAIYDRLIDLLAYLAVALIVVAWLSVVTEVFMRYFLRRPQVWVIEIAEYILLAITFLGAAWLLKKEGHVTIDMLPNSLSPKNRALLTAVTSVLGAMVCLAIAWWGAGVTWALFQRGAYDVESMLRLPKAPLLGTIPIGSFLLFIQFLRRATGNLRSWKMSASSK